MRFPLRGRPVVLTVAGSDGSGGAGVLVDLRTIEARGGRAAAVVTAVTAQNDDGVVGSRAVSARMVRDQLLAVLDGLPVAAVKSGMLANGAIVRELARALRRHRVAHYVCDPVLAATAGPPLLDEAAIPLLVRELFPLASLVTPNVAEAERLTGIEIADGRAAERAAKRLLASGAAAVLIKGGHRRDRPACDLLVTGEGSTELPGRWIEGGRARGTGCRLASAVATGLARGWDLLRAVSEAKRFVGETIAGARKGVRGLHVILDQTLQTRYGHVELARRVAAAGADVVQYRDKRPLSTSERVATASGVIAAVARHGTGVIVNDRADVAEASGALGVHLGPHDLAPAAARRLLGEQAVIGATANDLAAALRLAEEPVDYLGVGPVFGTSSKVDPAPALGLEGLAAIVRGAGKPVVAIGNITPEQVAPVLAAGASGIAVLSGVVCRPDPGGAARRYRRQIDNWMRERERRGRAETNAGMR